MCGKTLKYGGSFFENIRFRENDMKKAISLFLTMLAVCLTLAGCSKMDDGAVPAADSRFIGTWKAVRATHSGQEHPIAEVLNNTDFIIILNGDGSSAVITDKEEKGTWTEKKKAVHVKAGKTDTDFQEEDGSLVITIYGMKLFFERQ